MGFVCELFVSGALTATYNIKAGIEAPPPVVCMTAALVASAEGPAGKKVDFKLSNDGNAVGGRGTGSVEHVSDTKDVVQIRQNDATGFELSRPISRVVLPMMKDQIAKDTTPGVRR